MSLCFWLIPGRLCYVDIVGEEFILTFCDNRLASWGKRGFNEADHSQRQPAVEHEEEFAQKFSQPANLNVY
jgi:hypothetical protein